MSTIEKLIVQIFERKKSIIEQVRHQVELYDQQLASKLVIQGIDPPSWLWNHEAPSQSSDPSEINKQRLISELLLPLPQQAFPYFNDFNYDSISIPSCNFDQPDEPLRTTCFDDVRYVPDIYTEVEPAASSPQQQVATRLDDGKSELDLSQAEFKRSKSRQRALEMRSSAKNGSKSQLQDANISVISYKNSSPCMNDFLRCNFTEKPESAKYLNIQRDDEDINTRSCTENKASEELDNLCDFIDHDCCKTKIVGAVFSGQVNKQLQSQDLLNIHHEGDTESEDIKIQSSNDNKSSGSIPIQHFHHGASVDRICKSKNFCSGGQLEEDVIGSLQRGSPSAVSLRNHSTDAAMNLHNLSNKGGELPLPCRIIRSENSSQKLSDAVPTLYAANRDGGISSPSPSESLQDHPHAFELPDLVRPFGIFDNSSGMMEEGIENHLDDDKRRGSFSGSPTKLETSMQKNSEFVPIFSAAENEVDSSGVFSSCEPLQNHEHVLESLQSVSPSVITASNKKGSKDYYGSTNRSKSSGVIYSELHSSSCGLEGGNSLLEQLKVLSTETEVPQLQRATVEQPYLQKEDAILSACDYPLFSGDLHDQANKFRVQSVPCHVTSQALEGSYNMQVAEDNIGLGEDLKREATASLLKRTTLSFSKVLGKVETEDSLRCSSVEAKETIDDSLMIERRAECFLEGSSVFLDMEAKLNKDYNEQEKLSNESGSSLKRESYAAGFEENDLLDAKYIDMMDTDQNMPALEGFIMDSDNEESHFSGAGIGFDESTLPSSTLGRASILERLCQSASRNTPISHFPTTYRLHKTSDLYQSVPNGLLEHISLVGDYSNKKFQHKSRSAGLPVSTDQISLNASTPYASPFKKQWDHSTSSSGLGRQGSLNPELVCFTIEEDPGNCDEIGNHDGSTGAPPSHATFLKSSLKRKPLSDITEDGQNPPSVSANNIYDVEVGQTPIFHFRSHLDSAGTEANLSRAQSKVGQKLGKKFSNKKRCINDAKDNRNLSVGANGVKQVADAPKETKSQKPKCSENLNTKTGVSDQQKVLRNNNIVSNISSFIPLVQQKKAAAVVTGKRDIRVKALEAAEAAKRLEKKKENERKKKKEAWKAEKARLEQENLLQLELKKKKKEEELKKKEAEMAARKRVREEEEKKEKEGKRRRVEEARKQQHEQEKKRADKLDKETKHQATGLRIHEKKDPNSGLEPRMEMEMGEHESSTVLCDPKTMLCDLKGSNTLMKASMTVAGNGNLDMVKSGLNSTAEKNSQVKVECQQSYDISPYQGSDEEDEDDDSDRRKDKFVPAWASKNSLAEAIFSQQLINPDEILPPESFCSISEVLIPRKLQAR